MVAATGHLGGHVAILGTAHAVGQDRETQVFADGEAILIYATDDADVRLSCTDHGHEL